MTPEPSSSRSPRPPRKPVVTPAAPISAVAAAPVLAAPAVSAPPPSSKPVLRRDIFGTVGRAPSLCIVCATAANPPPPLITMDVTYKGTPYCYVAHKGCWEGISERERRLYDKSLLRLLERGAT